MFLSQTDPNDDDVEIKLIDVELESKGEVYWLGVLFIINGLLLVFGAFLAWETRKIDMKVLNDSRFIGKVSCVSKNFTACLKCQLMIHFDECFM